QAIADEVGLRLKHDLHELPTNIEGYGQAEWVLADYGDLLVHIFSPKSRDYYALERLWRGAKRVEIPAERRFTCTSSVSRKIPTPTPSPKISWDAPPAIAPPPCRKSVPIAPISGPSTLRRARSSSTPPASRRTPPPSRNSCPARKWRAATLSS